VRSSAGSGHGGPRVGQQTRGFDAATSAFACSIALNEEEKVGCVER
jgi:hypothetical protein